MGKTGQDAHGAVYLPGELTSFVGREGEITEVKDLLSAARAVTLVGPGGVGKTRLALRVAGRVRRAFAGGVVFVDLASLQDADLLTYTVAGALGIESRSPSGGVGVLTDFLRDRHMLLVFDNCEQLADACAELINTLLRAASWVRVLATSRQLLGVTGERRWQVPPLPVPDPDRPGHPAGAPGSAALTLFAERAASVTDFTLTDENWREVARLCRRLDGLPLAIELAAAGTRVLSVQAMLERLDGRLRIPASPDRAAPARHRSLAAVVDTSYDLCSPQERLLWARASVFAGHFTLYAAEQVCSDVTLPADTVLDLVTGLVDKSVLIAERRSGEVRYRLLDTLAHYGRERLREAGEEDTQRRRHRDLYLSLAARLEEDWYGPRQVERCQQMQAEHANIRAALDYCLTTPGEGATGMVMIATLIYHWTAGGHLTEGRHWCARALALDPDPTLERISALLASSVLAARQGDGAAALRGLAEYRAIARDFDIEIMEAHATAIAGYAALTGNDPESALAGLWEGVQHMRRLGVPPEHHLYMSALASLALLQMGEFDQAAASAEEVRRISAGVGEHWFLALALTVLGCVEFGRHAPQAAAEHAGAATKIGGDFGDAPTVGTSVRILAWVAMAGGDHRRGAVLTGVWLGIQRRTGAADHLPAVLDDITEPLDASARAALGESGYRAAIAEGADLDLGQAVAFALGTEARAEKAARNDTHSLTKREQQVAELVAEGMSNKEISHRLVIAQRTAESHVDHIRAKLGFSTRAQIATWATRRSGNAASGPQ
ncbi:LuxR C-terminal-related transcriptional regulator [Streptomyces sp. NBC_00424]|uniref:ATP-binding protein n=1 Tax=Streptomyces sp. NBC_00424 TaxID=2903648 RepID=UPI002257F984|nr:LuxR C-terminal-related transcriptional regulator [Streptomyces sp. NBC_00424]MCX5078539.1 LuxR C-terminal-related transcriptional regulator [Streptomyces sp. NBC_00424]